MTNFKKQFLSLAVASTVLLGTATPVLADTTIQISGNGSDSSSAVNASTSNTTTVLQGNNANVTNNVTSNSNSGNNSANNNTGGSVKVETGDASSYTKVANDLNKNAASISCCNNGGTNVLIDGNGTESSNKVNLSQDNSTKLTQQNQATVNNNVASNASTGDNSANDNTGGDVRVLTGDARVNTSVSTTANANVAQVGNSNGGNAGGGVSAVISGNGSDSENTIGLAIKHNTDIWQANNAWVNNTVSSDAETGDNSANDNTGGDVTVGTGDASTTTTVDNHVNFNAASIDCNCLTDNLLAKVAGNGTDSENNIRATLANDRGIFQGGEGWGNKSTLNNDVASDGATGDNNAKDNTGPVLNDPVWVLTGDSSSNTAVNNAGNVNEVGLPFSLPGNWNLQFGWDFSSLMGML